MFHLKWEDMVYPGKKKKKEIHKLLEIVLSLSLSLL